MKPEREWFVGQHAYLKQIREEMLWRDGEAFEATPGTKPEPCYVKITFTTRGPHPRYAVKGKHGSYACVQDSDLLTIWEASLLEASQPSTSCPPEGQ